MAHDAGASMRRNRAKKWQEWKVHGITAAKTEKLVYWLNPAPHTGTRLAFAEIHNFHYRFSTASLDNNGDATK